MHNTVSRTVRGREEGKRASPTHERIPQGVQAEAGVQAHEAALSVQIHEALDGPSRLVRHTLLHPAQGDERERERVRAGRKSARDDGERTR